MGDPTSQKEDAKKQAEYDRLLHRRKGLSGSEFAGLGFQFAATIVAFMFLGIWLDRRLGISPWGVLIGVFAGAGLGFWSMYRRVSAKQTVGKDSSTRASGDG